jgi:acyl-CoA synthetase (AMP-forming)/AMP-acid ligase II
VFDDITYTFHDWNCKANQVARWARDQGLKRGDVVAVMMENKPECLFTWTGLAKIGAVAALINNNLRGKPLIHCIRVCGAKHFLFGNEVIDGVSTIIQELQQDQTKLYVQGGGGSGGSGGSGGGLSSSNIQSVDEAWKTAQSSPVPQSWRDGTTYNDACMYIFTSGTTGLPKAAIVKHAKLDGAGAAFSLQFNIRHEDRIYNSGLPLYHSAANNVGGGVCLTTGATLILRRKFSASNFWKEVGFYNCTVVQYIGELARYLLATPPSPHDTRHNCRLAVGNGLRPDIWEKFQTRFNIKEIGEFYGATEGNVALFNHAVDRRAKGAVGHMGILFKQLGLCTLLRYDPERGEIIRDPKTGFCMECKPGEAGEAVAEMKGRAAGSFDGYLGDKEQSEKKLLRNVFRKGDVFFRTGDLLARNADGYYFFIDRLGDTFRWKGENVATTEVQEIISQVPGVLEVTVYGVEIPGKDGRACCAAIVSKDNETVNLDDLFRIATKELPQYAVPMFIRFLPKINTTGTFKHQKNDLKDDGMNIKKIKDAMFFLEPGSTKYVPLNEDVYQKIVGGKAKL